MDRALSANVTKFRNTYKIFVRKTGMKEKPPGIHERISDSNCIRTDVRGLDWIGFIWLRIGTRGGGPCH